MKLNQTFENLQNLALANMKDSYPIYIGKFKHLSTIQLLLPKSQNERNVDESHIETFFEENTNIFIVSIGYISLKILQKLSKCLPMLEVLQLNSFAENFMNLILNESELIRFYNVQDLTIQSDQISDKIHKNVLFDSLVDFNLLLRDDFNENWMNFIDNQISKHLTRISIDTIKLKRKHLLTIASTFPNIESATFRTKSAYVANDIVEFLARNENLQKLDIVGEMQEIELELLSNQLPKSNWMFKADFDQSDNTFQITISRYGENNKLLLRKESSYQKNRKDFVQYFTSSFRKYGNKLLVMGDVNDDKKGADHSKSDDNKTSTGDDSDCSEDNAASINQSKYILIIIMSFASFN